MSITKEIADKIVSKLGAICNSKKNRPHDLYNIYHDGKLIASFGIRRSSKKDIGHGHIPGQLHISQKETLCLGQCTMSKDEWVDVMKDKNFIAKPAGA